MYKTSPKYQLMMKEECGPLYDAWKKCFDEAMKEGR
jgi:hypothetical protein